ncbi:MAG: hypothetical protein ACW990_18530, partial [Promethearchaeota archaeon]
MTEIKKITKISILAYGIVSLIFAVLLIFFLDMFLAMQNMPTWQNPAHPRMFGGALIIVVIFAVLVLIHKGWDWEKIKLAYEIMYLWIVINIIMEGSLLAIYSTVLSSAALTQLIMDLIIMSILLVLGVYSYIK